MKQVQTSMSKALKSYLRKKREDGFTLFAVRFVTAGVLALALPLIACAYTVILRGGRRVEIPANFTVTRLTLTYETSPGINITLLMSSIDIQATERANNEPEGSLLKRADPAQREATSRTSARGRASRRELTKQDIEAARLERARSEEEYERRRKELGLPSLEEMRRRNDEETKRLAEATRQNSILEAQSESYWRSRSASLRTEIAALDAQINYVRARLREITDNPAIGSYAFITGVAPGFHGRRPVTRFPNVTGNPGFMRGAGTDGPRLTGSFGFGGMATRGHVQFNTRPGPLGRVGRGRRGAFFPGVIVPAVTAFGLPYSNYDYTGERANLLYRLQELEAARSGFQARWRLLEEEARRAGAQPGWLRP
jgi:hypothetical protein